MFIEIDGSGGQLRQFYFQFIISYFSRLCHTFPLLDTPVSLNYRAFQQRYPAHWSSTFKGASISVFEPSAF
jgi:hypothetical protein